MQGDRKVNSNEHILSKIASWLRNIHGKEITSYRMY